MQSVGSVRADSLLVRGDPAVVGYIVATVDSQIEMRVLWCRSSLVPMPEKRAGYSPTAHAYVYFRKIPSKLSIFFRISNTPIIGVVVLSSYVTND